MIVLPNVVGTTITWLNTVSEVTDLFGDRIGTELPAHAVWPACRIDPTGGFAVYEYRLDQARLAIHSFAASDLDAYNGARLLRAAVAAMAGYRIPNAVVVVDVTTSSVQLIDEDDRAPHISHATFVATVSARPDP